jgi:hypothetical protein
MQHFSLIWLRLSFYTSPSRVDGGGGLSNVAWSPFKKPAESYQLVDQNRPHTPVFKWLLVSAVAAVTKKNAGDNAGVGIQFQKNQQVFQGKSHLARRCRGQWR